MTSTTTQPQKPRLALALRAAADSWDSQQEPAAAVLDELAAAIVQALEQWAAIASTSAELQELHAWAQAHHERQQHAEFFALLARLKSVPPQDIPPEDLRRMTQLAPARYIDAVAPIVAEYLPQATHYDDNGSPVFSIEQMAQHFGAPACCTLLHPAAPRHRAAADLDLLGLANCLHAGAVHPLQ